MIGEHYGTVQVTFKDDSFTLVRNRIEQLCDRIQQIGLKIAWECNTRVDLIDRALLKRMTAAGCNIIKVGIESGSDRILEKIDKGITLEQIRSAAKLLNDKSFRWFERTVVEPEDESHGKEVAATISFLC